MNIDVNYENKGKKLLQDIVKIDSKTYIRLLAAYIISNRKTELQTMLYYHYSLRHQCWTSILKRYCKK